MKPSSTMLVSMRRKTLDGVRTFVHELFAATRAGRFRRAEEARLTRAYLRLPASVKKLVAGCYRQYLMARDDRECARAREAVVAELVRGAGLTREELFPRPAGPDESAGSGGALPAETPMSSERRRPGSQPDSALVVTTALPERQPKRPPSQPQRGRRRQLAYTLAVMSVVACLGALATRLLLKPAPTAPEPAPTARETFPIESSLPVKDGLLFFSHGEIHGDTTWLNVFEFNASDQARPAVDAFVEADASDLDGIDDKDIVDAEPVLSVDESHPRIPARSVRRWRVPVKTRGDRTWVIRSSEGQRDFRVHERARKSTRRPSPDR